MTGSKDKKAEEVRLLPYTRINWFSLSTLPETVTNHGLWPFHQALVKTTSSTARYEEKKYWALASIKSLIEADINKDFVIEAGLAYERDVDNGVYVLVDTKNMFYTLMPGKTSEFQAYRNATGNEVSGDKKKGDILRTSPMQVSPFGGSDYVSYHPHVSYPTLHLKTDDLRQTDDLRRHNKKQQIDFFFSGLLNIWQRIQNLPKEESRKSCLIEFCSHINIDGIGCANERLGTAIYNTTEKLVVDEDLKILKTKLLKCIEPLLNALASASDSASREFDTLFNEYLGYKIEGIDWIIGEDNKQQFQKLILDIGINEIRLLDESDRDSYIELLEKPIVIPEMVPTVVSTATPAISISNPLTEQRFSTFIHQRIMPLLDNYQTHLEAVSLKLQFNTREITLVNEKQNVIAELKNKLLNDNTTSALQRVRDFYECLDTSASGLKNHREPAWNAFVTALITVGILLSGVLPGLAALAIYANTGDTKGKSMRFWKSYGANVANKLEEERPNLDNPFNPFS